MTKRRAGTGETPPEPGTLIHVSWEDCFSHEPWTPLSQISVSRKPPLMETVGWFRGSWDGRTCTFWTLCSGLQTEDLGEVHVGGSWFIPSWSVITWRAL